MKETFTLAHLSDFHLFSLKGAGIQDFLNKRIYAYLRWRTHRFTEHRADILKTLASDLQKTAPDHIVITGDLTHSGLKGEFAEAEKVLQSLGPPALVTAIPGNHDTYVASRGISSLSRLSSYLGFDQLKTEPIPPDLSLPFPTLTIRKHVALIGVSTALPSLPFLAVGRLGAHQLTRLGRVLDETGRKGLFRVILIHHPPCEGMMSWRKRLMDLDAFGRVLADQGAELVLHGHVHRNSYCSLKKRSSTVPVIGVPSSTSLGRTREKLARYHLYSIPTPHAENPFRVRVRVYSPADGGSFVDEPFSWSGCPVINRS